jgi:hypothetical protein
VPGVVPVKITLPPAIDHEYPGPDTLPDKAIEPVFKVPLLPSALPLSFIDADITKGIAVDVSNQYP